MWKWWVVVSCCVGLLARLVLALVHGGNTSFYDEHDYQRIALSLLETGTHAGAYGPTAFRAPGQSAWIAVVYAVMGHRPQAVHLAQAVLLLPLPYFVGRLARLVSGRPLVAIVAMMVTALNPALTYASATLYPVALSTLAVVVATAFASVAVEDGKLHAAFVAGGALAVAGLTTSYFALLPFGFAALLWLVRRKAAAVVLFVVAIMPIAAWSARNARTLGTYALTTNDGYNLALGANDRATPRSGNWVEPDPIGPKVSQTEVAKSKAYKHVAMRWILQHPLRYAELALGRAVLVFDTAGNPRTAGEHASLFARLSAFGLSAWILLGVVGLMLERKRLITWFTALVLCLIVICSAATITKARFRFPVDPLLGIYAAIVVERMTSRALTKFRKGRKGERFLLAA